jgi:acetyl esterase/lipase
MFLRSLVSAALTMSTISIAAQQTAWQPEPGHTQIPIWPNGAPGAPANAAAEVDTTSAKDNLIGGKPLIRLGNVSTPTITLYKPELRSDVKDPRPAVVVFPGGGYNILAIDLEGTEVCDWLNGAGVACVLLKYRVPGTGPYPKSPAALQDAQRAVGLVRQHAAEWSIDP